MQQEEPNKSRCQEEGSRRVLSGEYGHSDDAVGRRVGDPHHAHHDRGGRHLLAQQRTIRRVPEVLQQTGAARPAPHASRLGRLAVLSIVAVVALSLSACGGGGDSESSSKTSSGAALLPRDVIIPLSTVQEVLPEMSQETATGQDESALGNPTGTRSVTYATGDGSQRLVISVAQYQGSEDASSTFQQAVQGSREAPGGEGETVSGLGQEAFIGTSAQGGETHVGGGARYGDLIVNATLQGYDGTDENKAKVTELIRRQAAAAEQAL